MKLDGGEKKIVSHHKKNENLLRERIDYLRDDNSEFLDIGAFSSEGRCVLVGDFAIRAGVAYLLGK